MNIWESKTSDELMSVALATVTTNANLREMAGTLRELAAIGDDATVAKILPLALAYAYAEGVSAALNKPKAAA